MRTTTGNVPWEIVPASRVYEIFDEVVKLAGFKIVRKGVLAKQVNADITHLVGLGAYKGGSYGLRWGASLTYMPHRWENELSWHRSLKSVVFDLFDQPFDLPRALNLSTQPLPASFPSALHGPELFERDLRRERLNLESTITSWLGSVSDLSGVLLMSEEQMQRSWTGPRYWPPPSLVHAFTLARTGNLKKAAQELRSLAEAESFQSTALLERALEKVSR